MFPVKSKNKTDIHRAEARFHDEWAASVDVNAVEVDALFETGACPENAQILEWMGNLRGKQVLDVGCGCGEASVYFARRGADVTAVDISPGMLVLTEALAARFGVSVKTACISADDLTSVADGAFDCVYAANLLHHVDVSAFVQAIRQKLKPGGEAYFWDPVAYNPVINVYRRMATAVRTEDEHPLRMRDLAIIRAMFASVETRFYWYSALLVFVKYFLVDRIHPNHARYWKKVIEDGPRIGPTLSVLHRIDRALFARTPGVRWLAWNVVVRARTSHSLVGRQL